MLAVHLITAWPWPWPFDLMVNACWATAMRCMRIKFGVDSSCCITFGARTHMHVTDTEPHMLLISLVTKRLELLWQSIIIIITSKTISTFMMLSSDHVRVHSSYFLNSDSAPCGYQTSNKLINFDSESACKTLLSIPTTALFIIITQPKQL